tara:strand:- start:1526 stop:1876 length:351 start_codon:yes stop_codon:yes gene_type:complete
MDFSQKYTGDEFIYQLEVELLEEIESLPKKYAATIIQQIDIAAIKISDEGLTLPLNYMVGVVNIERALFFKVHFITIREGYPVFYKFDITDSDEYLDYLNLIKSHETQKKTIKNET